MQRPQIVIPRRRRTRPPPSLRNAGPWTQTGETKDEYAIRTLNIALDVHFDKDDREFHGDIRYDGLQRKHNRALASEDGRWRDDTTPLEPLKLEVLVIGKTYRLGQLPLGSTFIMPDGSEKTLNKYNYAPQPSRGAIIKVSSDVSEENNGFIVKKGVFTDLGNKKITFVSHPHVNRSHLSKSAASVRARSRSRSRSRSPKAAVKTPSPNPFYKKKAEKRTRRVLSRKRSTRRKRGSRARTESPLKLKSESKSPTRRRAKSK